MTSPVIFMQQDTIPRGKSRLFTFAALMLFGLILVASLVKQNYFSQTTTLYFFSPNGQGLNIGMAVKFAGFKVGSIKDLSIDPQAQVKATLSLNNDYIHLISKDAKARLIKEGLIGESVVEIISPDTRSRQVAQNDVLQFERARDIAELADNLVGKILPILEDVKKITAAVSDSDQDIRESIRKVNQVSDELLNITRQANTLVSKGNKTLGVVHHSVETLDAALPGMVGSLGVSLTNLQATTEEIRKMTTSPSGQIPQLLNSSNTLVRDGRDIVGAAKSSWPISAILPEPQQGMLPLDGYAETYFHREQK